MLYFYQHFYQEQFCAMPILSFMQRQSCYSVTFLGILHLTFLFDREPLIWPKAVPVSSKLQIQQPGAFSSCCSTAVNTSSLQLLLCWLSFRHLFPVFPGSLVDSEEHYSCSHSCCNILLPLCCIEDSVQRLVLIFHFPILVFPHESSVKNAWPHEPSPCHRISSTVYFYKHWCIEACYFTVFYNSINAF